VPRRVRTDMFAYDPATNPLNNNEWAFPLLECVHISMFAMSIGTIALVDLRLLGLGMRRQSSSQLARDTSLWTMAGLFMVITSGLLIFTTDPLRYYYNWAFRLKIVCLLLGILYNYTIHRKVALSDPSPVVGKLVGGFSLILWVSVVFGGLFYAFT
jgi:hypothetical protein